MLIIGHRGARGSKPENTLPSLRHAFESQADILEFDVRVTKDKIPILVHDKHMVRSHRKLNYYRMHSYKHIQKIAKNNGPTPATLDAALKETFGKIVLFIEIKEPQAVEPALKVFKQYTKKPTDWDNVMFVSFKPLVLRKIRQQAPHASLAMLHHRNPLNFLVWYRPLKLSAVGFHRLYLSNFARSVASELGLFTYVFTVNRSEAAQSLSAKGYDGIVTDYPEQMIKKLS